MSRFRPRSVLRLVLYGFFWVTLPLIGALIFAVFSVDKLIDQSQLTVSQAVEATKSSLTLVDQLTTMERRSRQYLVLGEENLYQNYKKTHQDLRQTLKQLSALPMSDKQEELLQRFRNTEAKLFSTLSQNPHQSARAQNATAHFGPLSASARAILTENQRLVEQAVAETQLKGEQAQRSLLWPILGVIPIVILFVGIFAALIARPIRQIDQAIRQIGDGSISEDIKVSGPKDLELLGQRLQWLRKRLRELEEQKSQFLRHVSHELKTPLTAARAGAELLNDDVVGQLNLEQRKVVQVLHKSLLQLQKMIENLLNFSVVLERHQHFTIKPLYLDRIIEKILADHHLAFKAKSLQIDWAQNECLISGDEEKLAAVLDNIVSNAVKFSPDEGHIQIQVRQEQKNVIIDITDSGPGVAPQDKARIFDPFYQGKQPEIRTSEGTGIGLSLAKAYALAHQGRIESIDHPEPDKDPERQSIGGHFRVTLPLIPFEDAA